jgi:hypothetical protein
MNCNLEVNYCDKVLTFSKGCREALICEYYDIAISEKPIFFNFQFYATNFSLSPVTTNESLLTKFIQEIIPGDDVKIIEGKFKLNKLISPYLMSYFVALQQFSSVFNKECDFKEFSLNMIFNRWFEEYDYAKSLKVLTVLYPFLIKEGYINPSFENNGLKYTGPCNYISNERLVKKGLEIFFGKDKENVKKVLNHIKNGYYITPIENELSFYYKKLTD